MSTGTRLAGWAFAGPALMVIALFFAVPVLAALALSLTDFDIYALSDLDNLRFVGIDNYVNLLHEPLFWKALGNTFYFVIVGVPLSIAVSLGAALLLQSKLGRFKPFFRTAFFAPVVTTVVAVAVIWRYLFHTKLRPGELGVGSFRSAGDRLARRSALGDADDHPARGVEKTSVTTW